MRLFVDEDYLAAAEVITTNSVDLEEGVSATRSEQARDLATILETIGLEYGRIQTNSRTETVPQPNHSWVYKHVSEFECEDPDEVHETYYAVEFAYLGLRYWFVGEQCGRVDSFALIIPDTNENANLEHLELIEKISRAQRRAIEAN